MKTALKLFSKLALVVGISAALAFGAKEASACASCTQPPPTSCKNEINPNLFCDNLCQNVQGCPGGECHTGPDECLCFE